MGAIERANVVAVVVLQSRRTEVFAYARKAGLAEGASGARMLTHAIVGGVAKEAIGQRIDAMVIAPRPIGRTDVNALAPGAKRAGCADEPTRAAIGVIGGNRCAIINATRRIHARDLRFRTRQRVVLTAGGRRENDERHKRPN